MPEQSLADHILAAERLVLAREHPEKPYTLQTIRVLKGSTAETPSLDLFLDSSTRRRLDADPELSVLCGWSSEEQGWRRIALNDESIAPVVATIVANAAKWNQQPDQRAQYFAGLLAHENSVLSDLAHIEIARLPYAKILEFADRIPREKLYAELKNPRRMKWHALYILFLSRSDHPEDHAFIREGFAHAARYRLASSTTAWAAALIEIDGDDALQTLNKRYLRNPYRRPEEIAAIQAALKIHGIEPLVERGDQLAKKSLVEPIAAP